MYTSAQSKKYKNLMIFLFFLTGQIICSVFVIVFGCIDIKHIVLHILHKGAI